jgi:hypothetical protein
MITLTQCAVFAGLASDELIAGVSPSAKHRSLLLSYLLDSERGLVAVRVRIVADLRCFRELGALRPTADRLLVLRLFLTEFPGARCYRKRVSPCITKSELAAGSDQERADTAQLNSRIAALPNTPPDDWIAPNRRRLVIGGSNLSQAATHFSIVDLDQSMVRPVN